ncbi:hypothetical protein [Falsiroseomonas sp.]|uniref:hypothetical protein n=1 Tax=Falsiroseomonas sp. TaxID=2870721 RepID=UPI003F6F24C5
MPTLEERFDAAMMNIYKRARSEAKYNATIFLGMLLDKRGLRTAKQLINEPNVSDGYTALWERGRLDLTVEAMVIDHPEWHSLFEEEELAKARKRLEQYGYKGAKAG